MHFDSNTFRFVQLAKLVLALSVLCVNIAAQDWKTVADGVEYAQIRREFSGKPVDLNLLRLDLKKVRLDVHHAMDAAIGTEKTSSIATRHGAFAAINAGFFRLDNSIWAGEATNLLQIDGETFSDAPFVRVALFIINDQKKLGIDSTGLHIKKLFGEPSIEINKNKLALSGINRERGENEVVLFSSGFGRTTLTKAGGVEVTVRNGRVTKVEDSNGSSEIPFDGFVVSASGLKSGELSRIAVIGKKFHFLHTYKGTFTPGQDPIYDTSTLSALAEDVVAGVPQLIKNGKIDITWEQEKASKSFVETRHPRTAVAKLKDGKFLMLTADGRSDASAGLDLYDLAKYMLELGAVDAMNLDGGGSTTMFLDGKVVNRPSDKEGERKIGDAILVTLRKPKRK